MPKKVNIGENSLFKLMEFATNENVGSKDSIAVNEARPEVDEYEIGQESNNPPIGGNYCHVEENMVVKPINENKYDDMFNKTINSLENFRKQCALKYGTNCWYVSSWMKREHPEIEVDQKDIEINNALEKKYEEISKLWNAEDNKEQQEEEPKQISDEYDVISLAIKQYGTTNQLSQAGFILQDGSLLNFGNNGERDIDHRDIERIYLSNNIPIWNNEYRYNYVVDFMNHGAIRCCVNSGILDMTKEPTDEQYSIIKAFVRMAVDVDIDFTDNKGNTLHSVHYKNTRPQKVVGDIYRYYNEGIKPQGNVQYEEKDKKGSVILEDKSKTILVSENQLSKLNENLDFEVDSSEIDLSSFKKKTSLAPNIWDDNDTINSRVRLRLLDIADDFWKFVNLSWVKPKGIILTGSICNFNWSHYSDIDLHLIVDFNEIDEKTEFVKDYLDAKKNEWNETHSGLKIYDFQIELYVQDVSDELDASGVYDLEENKWAIKPNQDSIKPIGLNKFAIKKKAAEIMTIIDDMYDALHSTNDSHEIETIGDDAKYLWSKLKDMRKYSLRKQGESGSGNIVWKYLRRKEYLDKLWRLSNIVYDRVNSITESKNKNKKYTVYIDGEKDDTFSDMNWKRKPKVGKGFYYGGAVFKIKKVTDDSIYAIEESKNTSAQLLNEWYKIDYFEKAKQYFGTTNDLNECGFILPNGEMLDLSSVKGRRGIPHRNVEAIGVGLETFIEHGAIRCDSRYKLINICKKPTKEQINRLVQIIKANDGSVSLDLGNGLITFDYVDYKNVNYKRIINDIINFFDNKIKPSSLRVNSIRENKIGYYDLITESQESKSIAAAKKLVMQRLNYNEQQADEFIRIKLRNDIPILRTLQGGKFILGVTRMFCDGELRSANDINNINSTLKLVASDSHINEYDRNLNNLSCQELIKRFSKAMSDNLEAEKAEIGQMAFGTPSDYEIVRIDSFEQAKEYSQYVSWCVTHDERMFGSYTSDGINQFYFCLKHGFENVKAIKGEGCPLDEYGLSMIAVSVNESGMLSTCTCRWNHDKGGNDNIMNSKEVSQVIGMNFFEVFKPNNKWKELLNNVMQRLARGESPAKVFDYIYGFNEGFTIVELNNKWNFISQEGRILSDQWFDGCGGFHYGFARVELNDKCNFINQVGKIISEQWFDWCGDFFEGFASVEFKRKWNFINQEGRLLSDQWFDAICDFAGGLGEVKLNGAWYKIDARGNFKKIVESSLNDKSLIREYLEKDHNEALYRYFKWSKEATICEKAEDLAYSCPYYINKYIRKICYRYSEFENLLNDGEFDYEDESLIKMFLNMLEENNLCDHFVSEMQSIVDCYELPAWCTVDFNRIVKNEWCIHFGSDSESIAKEGFTGGTPEVERLAYTNAGVQKTSAGYDFAFLINDRSVDYNEYGDEAVIFRTSGVEIYHYGDNQNQVVFWGPNVKSFIPIHQDNGDWVVYGQNGQVLVRCGRPSEIALWATENLPQYRKQIMTGKNGYIPQKTIYDPKTYKVSHEPYPLYKNESIEKYIKLLKNTTLNEEWVADGNAEHNPYAKRWKTERQALKNFICNYGKLMQSKESSKQGRIYKVFYDQGISNLIGFNYGLCVQWDMATNKPKSTVYIRAIDRFTPNIRQNVQYDPRGVDNQMGTYDDRNYQNIQQ